MGHSKAPEASHPCLAAHRSIRCDQRMTIGAVDLQSLMLPSGSFLVSSAET